MKNLRTEDEIIANWKGDIHKPVVSICCITYNHEAYIEDALEGFLIQKTDFPFEILIHDDASTDACGEIIRSYTSKYPSIIKPIIQKNNQYRFIQQMNPVFNFPRAKGLYIALCEGDDYWTDKTKLQKQVNFLEANPSYVITYTDCIVLNEKDNTKKKSRVEVRDLSQLELETGLSVNTLTACFRNVFKTRPWPRYLNGSPYGDLAIWSILGEFGGGKYLDDILPSVYRVHVGGVHSQKSRSEQLSMRLKTMSSIFWYKHTAGRESQYKILADIIVATIKLSSLKAFKYLLIRLLFKK